MTIHHPRPAKWISATYQQVSPFRFEKQEGVRVSDERIKDEHLSFLPDFFYLGRPFRLDWQPLRPLDTLDGQSVTHPRIFSEMHRGIFQDVLYGNFITYNEGKKNRSTLYVEIEGSLATLVVFPHKSVRREFFAALKRHPANPLQLRPVESRALSV